MFMKPTSVYVKIRLKHIFVHSNQTLLFPSESGHLFQQQTAAFLLLDLEYV